MIFYEFRVASRLEYSLNVLVDRLAGQIFIAGNAYTSHSPSTVKSSSHFSFTSEGEGVPSPHSLFTSEGGGSRRKADVEIAISNPVGFEASHNHVI